MVTFFDYHSTAVLSPLFSLSTVCVSVCLVWLAYSFPEPPRKRGRAARGAGRVLGRRRRRRGACLMVGPFLGMDLRPLRLAVGAIAFASLLVLSATILFRLRAERGRRRQELRSSALGLAVAPALLALGFLSRMFGGSAERAPGAAVPGAAAAAVRRLRPDPPQRTGDQRRADAADVHRARADQRAGRGDRRVAGAARGAAQRRLDRARALAGRGRDAAGAGRRRVPRQQPPVLRGDRPLSPDAAAARRRPRVEGKRERSGLVDPVRRDPVAADRRRRRVVAGRPGPAHAPAR